MTSIEPALPKRVARAVSWLGHPFVFVMATVGIVMVMQMKSAALPILLCLFISVIVPTALLLYLGVRSGRWKDADVSVREERKRFYPWAIPISALGVGATWLTGAPFFVLRGALVTLGLFVAAALINTRVKISLHTLFAFYGTVILFRVGLIAGVIALLLAALVFWSRLVLKRHTPGENLAGLFLGSIGGILSAWWPY